jgi:import receptor subunit TOM22
MPVSIPPNVSKATSKTWFYGKKLGLSFGKAAWIASTTFLVLLVPLILELDREQQISDMEKEQLSVLTSPVAKA